MDFYGTTATASQNPSEALFTVEHCMSWRTPNRSDVKSHSFRIQNMISHLCFCTGREYNSDYRLYLESNCNPGEPFDLSVQLVIGTDVVSHCRTTVRSSKDIIWSSIQSEISTFVADIAECQFLFRIILHGNPALNKDAKSALTSLTPSLPSYHTEALSRDLTKLLDAPGRGSDVEIACGGQVFKAHRIVLGARSDVFGAMLLQSKMAESETGRVDIEDCGDGDAFARFLRYLYTGALPDLGACSAKSLYELADKYAVEELKRACASFLCRGLTKDNACDALLLADRHSDREFKEGVVQFLMRERIPRSGGSWSGFCKHHPALAIEVLNCCCDRFFAV